MTRVLALTGATGFLGGEVLRAAREAGWTPRILLRPGTPAPATPAETVPGTLEDAAALARLVAGATAVVHAAGLVRSRDPAAFGAVNVAGTARLVAAMRAAAPGARLVHLSSLAARVPGISPYAASKRAGETCLRGSGLDWAVLRPAAVYGPGDRATAALFRLADAPLQPLLGPDDARLCLVHVRDVASAVLAFAAGGPREALHEIADPRTDGYGWREIAATLATALGRHPRPVRVPSRLLAALAAATDAVPSLERVLGPLGRDKLAEMRHRDWSSSPAAQPPRALWTPSVALPEGFAATAAALRAAGHPLSPGLTARATAAIATVGNAS